MRKHLSTLPIAALLAIGATLLLAPSASAQAPSVIPVVRLRQAHTNGVSTGHQTIWSAWRAPSSVRLMAATIVEAPTERAFNTSKAGVVNCGIVTCTIYFTRDTTKWVNGLINGAYSGTKAATAAAIAGIGCSFVSTPLGGAVCAGLTGIATSAVQDAFQDATDHDECATLRYVKMQLFFLPPQVFSIPGRNGGRFCR